MRIQGANKVITRIKLEDIKRGDIFMAKDNFKYNNHIQQGSRPVIVVSNNACNKHSKVIEVVPMKRQAKNNLPTHVSIKAIYESIALCEQIKSINKYDMTRYIRTATQEEMTAIDNALKISLGL